MPSLFDESTPTSHRARLAQRKANWIRTVKKAPGGRLSQDRQLCNDLTVTHEGANSRDELGVIRDPIERDVFRGRKSQVLL
jgi:hypothetical protein